MLPVTFNRKCRPIAFLMICIAFTLAALFLLSSCATSTAHESTAQQTSASTSKDTEIDQPSTTSPVDDTTFMQQTATVDLSSLAIASEPALYTYDDMVTDLQLLTARYSSTTTLDSLGTTIDGREIEHLIIGNPQAKTQVLFIGGMHAREYMTSELVMKQAYEFLMLYGDNKELLDTFCVQVVPMSNPDGVSISQLGLDGIRSADVRDGVMAIADSDGYSDLDFYLTQWKANAQGIDINRQFDADWDEYNDGVGRPSADHYKGTAPECTVEAKAVADLTRTYLFDRSISYHTQGDTIYWNFGQTGDLYDTSLAYADKISATTGYPLYSDYQSLDAAGFKDWAIQRLGLVSMTIETGIDTNPVPADQFPQVWAENEDVWRVTLEDAGVTLPA